MISTPSYTKIDPRTNKIYLKNDKDGNDKTLCSSYQ